MRALLYCRVSTDAQERDGTSLDHQDRECTRYASERSYTVVETIRDSASGATLERPGIERLMDLVASKSIEVVVAYAVDRLARDQDAMGALAYTCRRHGVRIETVREAFDDTEEGAFIRGVHALVAQLERRHIRSRTREGKRDRAAEGKYVYSRPPYGYVRVGKGEIAIDEPRAAVVRDIFTRFLDGGSYRGIAVALNELGVPTMFGKPWERQVIKKMLQNEAYTGTLLYMGVRVDGAFPAIETRERFDRAQAQMNARPARGGGKGAKSSHLLTSLIYCECGAKMHGRTHTKGTVPRVYVCSRYAKGGGCEPTAHDAEAVEQAVIDYLEDIISDYPRVQRLRMDAVGRIRADLATVEAALQENEKERQNAIRAIRRGDPFAQEAAQAVVEDRTKLLDQKTRIEALIAQAERDRENDDRLPDQMKKLLDPSLPIESRKRIIQEALANSRVIVNLEGAVSIE